MIKDKTMTQIKKEYTYIATIVKEKYIEELRRREKVKGFELTERIEQQVPYMDSMRVKVTLVFEAPY